MSTIRSMIDNLRQKSLNKELTGNEAADILVKLSALYGNVQMEVRKWEKAYLFVLAETLKQEKMTVARAKITAQVSNEYDELQISKIYAEMILELTRALKYKLRALGDEWETSRNQV